MQEYERKNNLLPVVSDKKGITLIELMVAIAVTGILALGLVQVIRQTSTAIQSNRTMTKILDNLRSAGQRMTNDIRTVGRSAEESRDEYRLIGVDGDDRFEDADTTPGRLLSSPDEGDHLHLHAENTTGDTRLVCFFLNDGDHRYLEDRDGDGEIEWGVIRRDRSVDRDSFFSDGTDYSSTNLSDIDEDNPIGYNVDYLSFRYYDAEEGADGEWYDAWDSHDTSLAQIDPDDVPEYPDAIEVAIRGYDPSGDLDPRWYYATIGFNRGKAAWNNIGAGEFRRIARLPVGASGRSSHFTRFFLHLTEP